MKPQKYILLILMMGILSCQDIDSLVNSIAIENRIECEAIGFAGSSSSLYKKFEMMKDRATKEQLIKLTNHDSLAVVGYSAYALIDKELIEPDELLARFINDEDSVSTFCGCTMEEETLASLIYHRYWNSKIDYPDKKDYEKYIINDTQGLRRMDSLILYSKKPDWILLARAFENRIYSDDYTNKIQEWAFKKNNFYALKYVFQNMEKGNEEKLVQSFDEYVNNEDNHIAQKVEINQMKNEIQRILMISNND